MTKRIDVDLDEDLRVFNLLEKINGLFHQPLRYKDINTIETFANDNYKEIKELYYTVVWEWLPEDVKEEIENR